MLANLFLYALLWRKKLAHLLNSVINGLKLWYPPNKKLIEAVSRHDYFKNARPKSCWASVCECLCTRSLESSAQLSYPAPDHSTTEHLAVINADSKTILLLLWTCWTERKRYLTILLCVWYIRLAIVIKRDYTNPKAKSASASSGVWCLKRQYMGDSFRGVTLHLTNWESESFDAGIGTTVQESKSD